MDYLIKEGKYSINGGVRMSDIILSVIVPIYNAEKTLKDCVQSLLKCNNPLVEFLMIDDGSIDKSYQMCYDYSNFDLRIKVFHQENHGVSNARNNGIKYAKGKYLMFVDADDVLDNDWEYILDYLDGKDIYYFSDKLSVNADKKKMLSYFIGNNEEKIMFAGPVSKLIKRNLIIQNNLLFNEELINGEDMLFNIKLLFSCKNYYIINKSFYNYRNLPGSATKSFNNNIIQSDKLFHVELNKVFDTLDLDQEYLDNIKLFCVQQAIIMITYRLSYVRSYRDAKKYYSFLLNSPYFKTLNADVVLVGKSKLIFFLIKYFSTRIVYYTLKLFINIKNKKNKGFYFLKI